VGVPKKCGKQEIWAYNEDGGSKSYSDGIVVDKSGNIYLIGWFQPLSTIYNQYMSRLGSENMFFAKYDKNRNLIWAKGPVNSGIDNPPVFSVGTP
jgi:hypothetical protein